MDKIKAVAYALLAAAFYAVSIPLSKLLLREVGPLTMAALLYLGAGIGIGAMSAFAKGRKGRSLAKSDMPFVIGMILLDMAAPVCLMLGISRGSSSNASLLGNFEIVATSIIALIVFGEAVSARLWAAILLITLSSILLSFDGAESFSFSSGSLLVILATTCWGFENNCTRKISSKNTYEIVTWKGVFSGLGALAMAFARNESLPAAGLMLLAMLLGFLSYGLSIFLYVRAQDALGAARTSACYAIAPFIGAFLSFVFLHEELTGTYAVALAVMLSGSALVVADTLVREHIHVHRHVLTHAHGGSMHSHVIIHSHKHSHYSRDGKHGHRHPMSELEHGPSAE